MPVVTLRRSDLTVADSGRSTTRSAHSTVTLVVAVLGFFVITLDAVVVNVALPSIRHSLGGGISGLQWVVDGYTLAFAGLLIWAGALSDRVGARRVFAVGAAIFVASSMACGLAPNVGILVTARLLQGAAAALMMPASMSLLSHTFPEGPARARAVALWAMGGVAASTFGPLLGGLLTVVSWRLIFLLNLPVGLAAIALTARITPTVRHLVPFDWIGQVVGVVAMATLTYGCIEAGVAGFTTPQVVLALAVAVAAWAVFLRVEARVAHPMVPLRLFRSTNFSVAVAVGFAFVVGYYGLPFVMSLYLQQVRHLSALATGAVFLPMALIGAVLTPYSAKLAERIGPRRVIGAGLTAMAGGLTLLAVVSQSAPIWAVSLLMLFAGVAGPAVMPPVTAILLNSVPSHESGTASGVFNTSRQLGGALAVAIFGALIGGPMNFGSGLRISLLLAAAVAAATGAASRLFRTTYTTTGD